MCVWGSVYRRGGRRRNVEDSQQIRSSSLFSFFSFHTDLSSFTGSSSLQTSCQSTEAEKNVRMLPLLAEILDECPSPVVVVVVIIH